MQQCQKRTTGIVSICGLFLLGILSSRTLPGAESVDYLKDIKPIFAEKCYACHSSLKQEAELRLETRDLMLRGGDSGGVIHPKKPDQSLLLQRIVAKGDEQMPPPEEGSRLSAHEIALIKTWIAQGAKAPKEEIPGKPEDHWSFQAPIKAKVPFSPAVSSDQNPIDAFLEAQRKQKGLLVVKPASKRVLLRRVYLDLIGLPPTQNEIQEFLKDTDEDAYKKVIRKLLASPQYGERWGRHWMDIWRYTDWYGLGQQLRYSQKHIWHWRDWIIESLNRDSSYAEMIQDMLAADERKPTDHDALRATGFLARHYYLFNRTTWLDSTLEHTSKAFLGLTMNCTKCHDHKYDPLTSLDYYQMRAIFEPYQVRLDALPGEIDLEKNGLPRIFDAHPDAKTYIHVRGNEKKPDKSTEIKPGVPALFTFDSFKITPVTLPVKAHQPALQDFVLKDQLKAAETKLIAAQKTLQQSRKQLAKFKLKSGQQQSKPFLADDFKKSNPKLWTMGPGQWAYQNGKLSQTKTGYGRAYLRSKQNHPPNFKASFKFKTTGGDKWRSVGLAFDVNQNREKMIYLSAVKPGSKLQVSYNKGAKSIYPTDAKHDCEVNLNEEYELEIKVRDQLVNVSLNGKHAISYELPLKRESGKVELLAFDAAAEFTSINIESLSFTETLIDTKQSAQPSLKLVEAKLKVAETSLSVAQLHKAALSAAFAAEKASHANLPDDKQKPLIQAAALVARKYEVALAREKLAKAEEKFESATGDAKKKVEKKITAAKKELTTVKKAVTKPGENYIPVRASRKALESPAESDASCFQPYPKISTGRRSAFARWITHRKNPLTARVAVNHIWLRHFGQPLVDSVTDFGLRSKQPIQHQLLDWLAVEFMEHNWSMKHLHELIVSSKAYQLSSSTRNADPKTLKQDSENQYYWRRNSVRMESEVIRDSLLYLAEELDLTRGGPTIDPSQSLATKRRSLYYTYSRDHLDKFMSMFDAADIFACYRRSESVVPQQALALANSKVSLQMARKITERIQAEHPKITDQQFIKLAYEKILCVEPTPREFSLCLNALTETQSIVKSAKVTNTTPRARENLIHALLNHNDFITIR